MSKLFTKLAGLFRSRNLAGVDKTGNKYFTGQEDVNGIMKEKRWVIFKGEDDPITIPVEWICWLNGQRKKAPTPEEVIDTSGGCGASFEIAIVSEQFEGKRLLERLRMVNSALAEEMKEIHGLSIPKALTPAQWKQQ